MCYLSPHSRSCRELGEYCILYLYTICGGGFLYLRKTQAQGKHIFEGVCKDSANNLEQEQQQEQAAVEVKTLWF